MARRIKVQNNQTVWDIALQEYGSIDGAWILLRENPSIDLDVDLIPGTLLLINSGPLNIDVVNYLKEKAVIPATKA